MDFADSLNHGCICRTLDAQQLHEQLENHPGLTGLMKNLVQYRQRNWSRGNMQTPCGPSVVISFLNHWRVTAVTN